jgi:LysM repeat protein
MSTSFVRIVGLVLVAAVLLPGAALAAPAASDETIHVVQWGETLSLIAERYGVSVEAIMAANGLADPNFVYVGQRLIIPTAGGPGCAGSYTVQPGDTLSGIAWHYGTTVNALAQANGLYGDMIYAGQRLCVPGGGPGPAPAPGYAPAPPPGYTPAPPEYTYYTVRPGDTLLGIAWRFGVSQAALVRANNLPNPNFVYAGQRLLIPGVAPAKPRPSFAVASIVFARWDGGKYNLYVAGTDGGGEKLLLERAAGPSWSPDGTHISFIGQEGVDRQTVGPVPVAFESISNGVLVAGPLPPAPGGAAWTGWPDDLSRLNLAQIEREGSARATAWAPNGQMIAWCARPGRDFRIYFWAAEKTEFEYQSAIEIPGEHPAWSPDSAQLVYRSGRDAKQGLWISDRFDAAPRRVTADGSDAFPRWSPDGKRIAFQREADGNVDVYTMNPDGSDVRRLTDAAGPDALPAWTPAGDLVFRSARDGRWGVYVMKADGGGQQLIIPYADPGPDWTYGRMDVR